MEAAISIKPFGFDRVFRSGPAPVEDVPASPPVEELQGQIAALQERIEEMRQDRETALLKARAEGLAAGLAQARGERAEAMLSATDALHAALDELGGQWAHESDRIMREAAEVALCAAEMIAGHAIRQAPGQAIDEALGRVLRQVVRGTSVSIRVHPDSLEDVERLVAERRAGERRALNIAIVADATIARHDAHIGWAEGGLIVEAAARRAAVARELDGLLGEAGTV
ncbi:FliH/SctL family protein [Sphingobium sp. TCM1]|uniref:FliH/SctL family protein n=2 Tax=unclassified Sphingobium TaxID=2611147 RepID=UPI0007F3B30A|nr:FliH/SctL family protein [Sphingobium sp. TCM1]OAN52561.1 flagellar assembly protein H [Sphingobium sp. TCM1]